MNAHLDGLTHDRLPIVSSADDATRGVALSLHDRLIAERRVEIVEAATRVFARHGVAGATMHEIAAEVGLTAGALYRYFPSKDDLLHTILDRCREEHLALLALAAAAPVRGALDAIAGLGAAVWQEFDAPEAPARFAVQLEATLAAARSPGLGDPLRAVHRDILARLTELVRATQATREIDPAIDAGAIATVLLAAHHGLQQLTVLLGEEVRPHETLDVLVQMMHGLAARER